MLKSVETGDMLTIRNAYVVNNEFVRKSKSTNEDEMLHPLQTNHPRRLVLYVVLLEIVLSNFRDTNRHTINAGTTESIRYVFGEAKRVA